MTATRVAKTVAGVVGFVGALLGVMFGLWPALKPEGPPPTKRVELTNVTLDRAVTFGDYLARAQQPRDGVPATQLKRRGVLVEFDYEIEGYKGELLPVRYQLIDARKGAQVSSSSSTDLYFKALAAKDRGTWPLWVYVPSRSPGRYFVGVQLYDQAGRVPLARLRTKAFASW